MADDPGKPPLSPAWKRPTDVMKIRSKRRSSSSSSSRPALRPFNAMKSPTRSPQSSPARKRRNPFTASPNRKKLNLGPESQDMNPDSDFILFQMLDDADHVYSPPSKSSVKCEDFSDVIDSVQASEDVSETDEIKPLDVLPLDWSLKTKVRFISEKPFTWTAPMKTIDESQGISMYVRHSSELPIPNLSEQSELKSALMYWIHPNLPWLTLFPRQVPDSRIGKPSSVVLDDHMISALHRDWCQSFSSLFNLLKAGVCPYFYLLSHQFSVLFRAGSLCGRHNAVITPTTRGFREALSNEGIKFTMPLSTSDNDHPVSLTGTEDDNDIQNSDVGASLFLESIGVDKQKFPELNPDKVKLEREDYKRIDSRPESSVLVDGDETKQLFNYLLNCRSCVANTGVQLGVPPTLLAPLAFVGATLKSLQIKQGSLRQKLEDGVVKMYSLEVTGALLPDSICRLCDLLSRSQRSYTASLSTHEPTAAFNDARKSVHCSSYYPADEHNNNGFLATVRPEFHGTVRSMEFKDSSGGGYVCSSA